MKDFILLYKRCHLLTILFLILSILFKDAISLLEHDIFLIQLITIALKLFYCLRKVLNYRVYDFFITFLDLCQTNTNHSGLFVLIKSWDEQVEVITYHIQEMFIVWLWAISIVFKVLLIFDLMSCTLTTSWFIVRVTLLWAIRSHDHSGHAWHFTINKVLHLLCYLSLLTEVITDVRGTSHPWIHLVSLLSTHGRHNLVKFVIAIGLNLF